MITSVRHVCVVCTVLCIVCCVLFTRVVVCNMYLSVVSYLCNVDYVLFSRVLIYNMYVSEVRCQTGAVYYFGAHCLHKWVYVICSVTSYTRAHCAARQAWRCRLLLWGALFSLFT